MITGNVLITGGSGTLGRAIVRTAEAEGWDARFTIYSRSELRQAEMRGQYGDCRYILGDVRDYERLVAAFAGHDLVIHAAAMKRIPEAELHPTECYATNVTGSANVARAATHAGVARVVGISTDKACRAVTAYGASKLAMEKLFQAQSDTPTRFTLVRYGNVIGSNGSVIPLWRQQLAEGRPLTITSAQMTRFWMTERDAVDMVDRATSEAHGSIVVPKMRSLAVIDMARYVFGDVEMVETGLRSCEKLHEDLVAPDEHALNRGGVFSLTPGPGTGQTYTSYVAPRIPRDDFLAMLAESEVGV